MFESVWSWAAAGWLLGAASAAHCAAMCGPLSMALGSRYMERSASKWPRALFIVWVCLGKAVTYGAMGALFGFAGKMLTRWSGWMTFSHMLPYGVAVFFVFSAGGVFGWWKRLDVGFPVIGRWAGKALNRLPAPHDASTLFVTGLLWGLLPCPMVLVPALGASLAAGASGTGGAWKGFVFMFGFGLGTAPVLSLVSFFGSAASTLFKKYPHVSGWAYLFLAFLCVWGAASGMMTCKLSAHGEPSGACCSAVTPVTESR